jgi:hypothetical protein
MDRIRVIEGSLRCFIAGCLSMIPLLGIIAAGVAIFSFHRVRRLAGGGWNPAHSYLLCGAILAWTGLAFTLIGLALRFSVRLL